LTSVFFGLISKLRNQKEKIFRLRFDINKKELLAIFLVGSLSLSLCLSLCMLVCACLCTQAQIYIFWVIFHDFGGDSFITEKVCFIFKVVFYVDTQLFQIIELFL